MKKKKISKKPPDDYYRDTPAKAEIERLVAKLNAFRGGKEKQKILITSAMVGEGKTTVASLVAQSTARNLNEPTLIIDFDLRRPRLHHIYDVKQERGMGDILSSKLPIKACLKKTPFPNLVLLTSGIVEDSPIQLLNSDIIKKFFREVDGYFDNIIIDSPPVIPVSDPLIFGVIADHVILVVKAGYTSKYIAKRAIDMFYDVKVEIIGIVLNNMDNVLPYYYDYKSYPYQYYNSKELKQNLK